MSETITMKMRGRPVTHDEVIVAAHRLINSHFSNPDGARVSIPARSDDDDIVVIDYIMEQKATEAINAELLETLKGIANANWREWEPGLNSPEEFERWARSVAAHAIAKAEVTK